MTTTRLLEAVRRKSVELVESHLKDGDDPNERDTEGYLPILVSVELGCPDIAKILLLHGAALNLSTVEEIIFSNEDWDDVIVYLAQWSVAKSDSSLTESLLLALLGYCKDWDRKSKLLRDFLNAGVRPNVTLPASVHKLPWADQYDSGKQYLSILSYLACMPNSEERFQANAVVLSMCKELLDRGAWVNWPPTFPPLVIAIANKNIDLARMLLENGADVNAVTNSVAKYEWKKYDEALDASLQKACGVLDLFKGSASYNLSSQDKLDAYIEVLKKAVEVKSIELDLARVATSSRSLLFRSPVIEAIRTGCAELFEMVLSFKPNLKVEGLLEVALSRVSGSDGVRVRSVLDANGGLNDENRVETLIAKAKEIWKPDYFTAEQDDPYKRTMDAFSWAARGNKIGPEMMADIDKLWAEMHEKGFKLSAANKNAFKALKSEYADPVELRAAETVFKARHLKSLQHTNRLLKADDLLKEIVLNEHAKGPEKGGIQRYS